ncbi:transcriptional repressor, partial [Tyzzerella sp. OttesenSCG-928-J15]|nr:transcriptional repressor [Tyzzerella sp. OttesenSCG-928-J15]
RSKGLVQELNVGEDSFRYDADCSAHPHFLCKKCGAVYDLPVLEDLNNLKNSFSAETGHTIDSEQVYFYGVCKACKE